MHKALLAVPIVCLAAPRAFAAPSVTIYNQNFAVVRDSVPLDLQAGVNSVQFPNVTAFVEPDSVVLRDPAGKAALKILEQNYRSDAASAERMLKLFEGRTIEFLITRGEKTEIVRGKIIRAGQSPFSSYNSNNQLYLSPLVEVEGKLQFQLPGTPLFPALGKDVILRPTFDWKLESPQANKLDAELSYVTGRMSWEADYNIIAPENGEKLDLTGWVTLSNSSGKDFENARIKLMAGDVNKVQTNSGFYPQTEIYRQAGGMGATPSTTEKSFDEYHLYTLGRSATLRDGETKQVEMVHAPQVKADRIYIYDGMKTEARYSGYGMESIRNIREYGTLSNPKVWVMREFANTKANGLGVPLPKGKVRFYRQNTDGQIEFTGENTIDHTPQGETIRAFVGDAFDIVGSRTRTTFKNDDQRNAWTDETFEIKLRNRKTEPVEVRVVEHLYRGTNWNITEKSNTFNKTDLKTIEFRVQIQPNEEKVLTYTVRYSW